MKYVYAVYNAPFPSQYKWNASDLNLLIEKINQNAIELDCKNAIITGDLNFSQTNWNQKLIKTILMSKYPKMEFEAPPIKNAVKRPTGRN